MTVFTEVFWDRLLGLSLDPSDLGFRHMAWRAFIVFCCAVALARLGARRLLSHHAGFDIMVTIILGSVLSRAISGEAAFFPSLGASAVLVLLHNVVATLAFHWHWFSKMTKGSAYMLVRDGKPDREAMRRCKITDDDLDESLRLQANLDEPAQAREARLERNGAVSVVKEKRLKAEG